MLSVIIPVKNGASHIEGCLNSIRSMEISDAEIEVIVVDNGSTDDTREILASQNVIVLREETPGPYAARNRGANIARGDILAFTDIDCRVDVQWASSILTAMERFDAVCGMSLGAEGGEIARLIQSRYQENIENRASATPPLPIFDTRNAAVRKVVFDEVGGFDTRLLDIADDLLGILVLKSGHKIGFEPGMIITHIHPESLRDVGKRQRRHGRYIPTVRRFYDTDIQSAFPGLNRYGFVDRKGMIFRIAAAGLYTLSYVAALLFSSKLRISLMFPGRPFVRNFFDYYCRATTVQGIAEAGWKSEDES